MPPRPTSAPIAARAAIRLGLVVMAILVVLGVLEVVLRLRPTLLGDAYANGALSRYTVRAGGIYYRDRTLRMNFMIPNFEITMYANGYVWHHQTDALGFRNAPLHIPADSFSLATRSCTATAWSSRTRWGIGSKSARACVSSTSAARATARSKRPIY